METAVNGDPELASEVVGCLGRELKAARNRIKELEAYLEHSEKELESTVKALQKGLDDTIRENKSLRETLDEWRDSKMGIKKESLDIVTLRATTEVGVLTDGPSELDALQDSLEALRTKYKQEKESKKEWKRSCQENEKRASEVEAQNEELVRKSKSREPSVNRASDTRLTVAPVRRQDLFNYMMRLPKFNKRPHINDIGPIAAMDVDLSSLLTSIDPILYPVSNNFLYLPERVVWCDKEYHHAIGLGPQHVFDDEKDTWIKKSVFSGIYGKTITLFYLWRGHIYYGGLYMVINMRAWNPDGSSIKSKSVSPSALADTTIQNRVNSSTKNRPRWVRDVIAKMYQDEALNVEYLGLQCVGFDHQVYQSLRGFFEVSERMQSVKRAKLGPHPETPRGGKRQRIH